MTSLIDYCHAEIESLKAAKTWKKERVLEGPTGARVHVDGRSVLMLTSNNYLGFANHPRVVDAARTRSGDGATASAPCASSAGRSSSTRTSKPRSRSSSGPRTRSSTCPAGTRTRASSRRSSARRMRSSRTRSTTPRSSTASGSARRSASSSRTATSPRSRRPQGIPGPRRRLFITDGVFSMEGEIAPLGAFADLCEKYDATMVVDDSHATGVLGKTGRGSAEELGVMEKVKSSPPRSARRWARPPAASRRARRRS